MTAPARALVFITGASSGIGQALAARFYAQGHDLALVARNTQAIHDWAMSAGLDPARYTTVVIWCETFNQFITAARYR